MAIPELENLPDISFIDETTLDSVEDQMKRDFQNRYNEITGETYSLARGEPVSLILYACAVELFQMYMLIDKSFKENLLKYAEGEYLDNMAAGKGITRTPATKAQTTVRFTLSAAQTSVVAIPAGTRVTDSQYYFETDDYVEIPAGQLSVDVPCTAMEAGVGSNNLAVGSISALVDPIPYVQSVENIDVPSGGADTEDDDSLRERVFIAPDRHSTTGTEDAYKFWIRSFNQEITDARVFSNAPGEVDVCFLLNDEVPSQSVVKALQAYLEDPTIKPLNDKIVVSAPKEVSYDVSFTYWINSSDRNTATTIQQEVEKAVNDYATWQRSKIGRDINPSELVKRIILAGAKRVELKAPVFTKIGDTDLAKLGSKTITYGGLEDD